MVLWGRPVVRERRPDRYFEKTTQISGFTVGVLKRTKSERLARKDTKEYYHYNVEDEDDSKYEKEEEYIDFMAEGEALKATDLREAINELINHNKDFIADVLENLFNNFQKTLKVCCPPSYFMAFSSSIISSSISGFASSK